jgi:hypothetical protein
MIKRGMILQTQVTPKPAKSHRRWCHGAIVNAGA